MPKKNQNISPETDIFALANQEENLKTMPLSARMRPDKLEDYVGQRHILGEGKLLTRAIEADRISSLILYGPPGVGKTTLANLISKKTRSKFERLNAVCANVDDLRRVIAAAQNRRSSTTEKTILFIDEIHRFNKAQQDVLMPDVEEGNIILVGATVFNPFFSLLSPLLSRSLVFELFPLSDDEIVVLLRRAIKDEIKGLGFLKIKSSDQALQFIAKTADGDARRALNALEVGVLTTVPDKTGQIDFDIHIAQESIQKKQVTYDRDGDQHYDTISAFIKSMRGSDPDATLYWLAKMIYAGEDPRFIARRICICAAEDVGLADPRALILANAAHQTLEFIGMPEGRIPLAEAAVYVATAPKSNTSYLGIDAALDDIKNNRSQEVPTHLKDASYAGAKSLGRGKDYKYAHDYAGHFVDQDYVRIKKKYYSPTDQGYEKDIGARLEVLIKRFKNTAVK